ncbi:MAG TPA: hypothetical protein VLU47_12535, partial [Blastocatellia bacterium]|nr:hypothetical protein [Blastocatellia bacterium]
MNFGEKGRKMADEAKREQKRLRLARLEAERQREAEQYRRKLEEIESTAAGLADKVIAAAK